MAAWQATVDRYLLPLAVALIFVSILVSVRYRRAGSVRESAAARRRTRTQVLFAIVAFSALWLVGWFVASDRTGYAMDLAVAVWSRDHVSRPVLVLLAQLTHAGSTFWLTVVPVAMGIWQGLRGRLGVGLACLIAGAANGLAIRALKRYFARVRPDHLEAIISESSFSYPSGHSAGSLLVYGLLAWLITRDLPPRMRVPVFFIALLLVAAIASTRVLLQVHYVTDVIGGALLGSSLLALTVVWIRSQESRGAGTPGSSVRLS